jgi:hypothetical protein
MTHHVDYTESKYLLMHTDQEASARKAAELWVDYDMKRLDEMRSVERRRHDFNASTYANIGFHYVEPEAQAPLADTNLEKRLVNLCEHLLAKY